MMKHYTKLAAIGLALVLGTLSSPLTQAAPAVPDAAAMQKALAAPAMQANQKDNGSQSRTRRCASLCVSLCLGFTAGRLRMLRPACFLVSLLTGIDVAFYNKKDTKEPA